MTTCQQILVFLVHRRQLSLLDAVDMAAIRIILEVVNHLMAEGATVFVSLFLSLESRVSLFFPMGSMVLVFCM